MGREKISMHHARNCAFRCQIESSCTYHECEHTNCIGCTQTDFMSNPKSAPESNCTPTSRRGPPMPPCTVGTAAENRRNKRGRSGTGRRHTDAVAFCAKSGDPGTEKAVASDPPMGKRPQRCETPARHTAPAWRCAAGEPGVHAAHPFGERVVLCAEVGGEGEGAVRGADGALVPERRREESGPRPVVALITEAVEWTRTKRTAVSAKWRFCEGCYRSFNGSTGPRQPGHIPGNQSNCMRCSGVC